MINPVVTRVLLAGMTTACIAASAVAAASAASAHNELVSAPTKTSATWILVSANYTASNSTICNYRGRLTNYDYFNYGGTNYRIDGWSCQGKDGRTLYYWLKTS